MCGIYEPYRLTAPSTAEPYHQCFPHYMLLVDSNTVQKNEPLVGQIPRMGRAYAGQHGHKASLHYREESYGSCGIGSDRHYIYINRRAYPRHMRGHT